LTHLTAIVPFRAGLDQRRPRRRLARLLNVLPAEVHVVVVDDTADGAARAATAALIHRHPRARHLFHAASVDAPFSIGPLRDAGAMAAGSGFVLFHDVDFLAPRRAYEHLRAHLAWHPMWRSPEAVACVPVYFLTASGTATFRAAPGSVWRTLLAHEGGALLDRVVFGSSAILTRRDNLLAHGGHDGGFVGHGAEDFELLHRLCGSYPRGPRPADYAHDCGSRAWPPSGFRAYFARYGRPLLDAGVALVHQWHPRRREDPRYYERRQLNFERLRGLLAQAPDVDTRHRPDALQQIR
jgi:predicted glycosyltransferase involved in capsule biosynthesis